MSGATRRKVHKTANPTDLAIWSGSSERGRAVREPVAWLRRVPRVTRSRALPLCLLLTAIVISSGFAQITPERVLLPIEVLLSGDGASVSRIVVLQAEQAESVRSLRLQIHGLKYADQASVQVNAGAWIPLNNNTVTIAEPGKSFGGIGGGFATLAMTLPLPSGTVTGGANTIRFRFNQTDGIASGYRVIALNLLTGEGAKILPQENFVEDSPETWAPPLPDAASLQAGRELWNAASLVASSLAGSPKIQAHCADCHAHDGRDLKYFNFSNASIITRARFHGLSALQGEQIASYIRSLPLPNPGRPWNPPYQPGPGLDEQPVSNWAAGAGLSWVLDQDTEALPYLVSQSKTQSNGTALNRPGKAPDLHALVKQITPDAFRPDGNLNPREIPIALQLPDWSEWLPRVHPKDAWGTAFAHSEFAAFFSGEPTPESKSKSGTQQWLPTILGAAQNGDRNAHPIGPAFAQWSQARRAFLKRFITSKTVWSPELTNKVYSTQLWQLVKTWEMMQEFGLEDRGRDIFGSTADSRTWCNTIPGEASPSATQIPDGPAGVGGTPLTNEYFSSAWYELQIILNSGNHQHKDRAPVDWVYVIGRFLDLHRQTHHPEPARLLVAVTKALQSTDPHLGPESLSQGWRPELNIDPRIMVSPAWAAIFKPLPKDVHRALTVSLLAAWMDKNRQYPVAKYLPLGASHSAYTPRGYGEVSGGEAWKATEQFRRAGVPADLLQQLLEWGIAYTDRAARIQY
jgi:hypothetical protein